MRQTINGVYEIILKQHHLSKPTSEDALNHIDKGKVSQPPKSVQDLINIFETKPSRPMTVLEEKQVKHARRGAQVEVAQAQLISELVDKLNKGEIKLPQSAKEETKPKSIIAKAPSQSSSGTGSTISSGKSSRAPSPKEAHDKQQSVMDELKSKLKKGSPK